MSKIIYFFILCPFLGFSQVQIGQDIDGANSIEWSGYSVSVISSEGGSIVAIGAPKSSENSTGFGNVRVFQSLSGNWTQIGQTINGTITSGGAGHDVSLSSDGKILAIGSPFNKGTNSPGNAKIYQNVAGNWIQLGKTILGKTVGSNFGYSVSISADGTVVAVSAPYAVGKGGQNSGKVSVYRNISGTWTQIGSDIDDGEWIGELSGWDISLSADGNVLAVGTLRKGALSNAKGKVRVYRNILGNWTKIGSDIVAENALDTSSSVSLSADGGVVAIGARFNNGNGKDSGHVRVYENLSGTWSKVGQDIDGEFAGDLSGFSISLSSNGNIIAVGAPNNQNSGHVRVFQNISGTWVKLGSDIDGEFIRDQFGRSVSLSSDGRTLAIGGPFNFGSGNNSGHVRVYDLTRVLANNNFVLENFNIYPNPTSDVLNLSLENNLVLEQVTIYNNLGQVVKTTSENVIDVSHLAEGIYFVQVTTDKGKATKKVVVK